MELQISEHQQLMIDTARKVGEDFGLDYWRRIDAEQAFPHELWQAVCDAGLCGVALPEEHGGSGLGMMEMCLVLERLSAGGGGSTLGQLFMINPIFGGVSVSKYGTAEMKRTLLPALVEGRMNFCMALTESSAGSNSLSMKTFAARDGDGWRLNGQKLWITAVDQAQKMLVIARTTRLEEVSRKTEGLSMFMIDVDRPGLTYHKIDKVGTRTLTSCTVFFDDVHITSDELVGTLDHGWPELLDILNTERIVTTSGLVGAGELAIKLAVEYAKNRKVFGDASIASYQGIQFPLAQAHAEIECARLMNHMAAQRFDAGLSFGSQANAAKLIAAQAVGRATEQAMQTMGGMGYAVESYVERLWRDARLFKFAPVSEEMILNFIATHDLGMPRSY